MPAAGDHCDAIVAWAGDWDPESVDSGVAAVVSAVPVGTGWRRLARMVGSYESVRGLTRANACSWDTRALWLHRKVLGALNRDNEIDRAILECAQGEQAMVVENVPWTLEDVLHDRSAVVCAELKRWRIFTGPKLRLEATLRGTHAQLYSASFYGDDLRRGLQGKDAPFSKAEVLAAFGL